MKYWLRIEDVEKRGVPQDSTLGDTKPLDAENWVEVEIPEQKAEAKKNMGMYKYASYGAIAVLVAYSVFTVFLRYKYPDASETRILICSLGGSCY